MRSSAGPKAKSSVCQRPPPSCIGLALISTPLSIKSSSSPGSTKDGSTVVKVLEVREGGASGSEPSSPFGGKVTGFLKLPSTVSPWSMVMDSTFPALTSSLKEVYGTSTGASGPGKRNLTRRKFASSMSANHSQVVLGGMVLCLSGPDARRGSSGGLPEDRGDLSVVLVPSCGVVIGYLRRRAHALVYSNRCTRPPGGWPWMLIRWRTTVGSARGSSTTWQRSKRLVSRNFWRV